MKAYIAADIIVGGTDFLQKLDKSKEEFTMTIPEADKLRPFLDYNEYFLVQHDNKWTVVKKNA